MSMSRTETLDEDPGKGTRQILEHLLADEQFQGTLDGQLTRIAIYLHKPVRVWVSGHIKSGILEDFLPPIDDGDKVTREGMIRVSLHYVEEPLTIKGPIAELFEILSMAGTFKQSEDFPEEFDEEFDE
ncbi:hypothetical protein IFM53868_07157 [Aspergillus udagawae]|uniref:Replication factor A protein 3 n=1 Tax=Aspergillus udagawae TaxID=91492 RepID=A0ABQ1B415_9EURO|nr:hypothetical protein IFM53868_07157 [Aspergillus udagawae]